MTIGINRELIISRSCIVYVCYNVNSISFPRQPCLFTILSVLMVVICMKSMYESSTREIFLFHAIWSTWFPSSHCYVLLLASPSSCLFAVCLSVSVFIDSNNPPYRADRCSIARFFNSMCYHNNIMIILFISLITSLKWE